MFSNEFSTSHTTNFFSFLLRYGNYDLMDILSYHDSVLHAHALNDE